MDRRQVSSLPRRLASRPPTAAPRRPSRSGRFKYFVMALVALWLGRGALNAFQVKTIEARGVNGSSDQTVKKQAQQVIGQHWLWNNWLFLPAGQLAAKLQGSDANLKTVTVKKSWPNKIIIAVKFRRPSLNWQTGSHKYQIDSDGTIIGMAVTESLPTIIDTTNLPVSPGDKVVPSRFITFVQDIVLGLKKQTGLNITSLKVPDTTSELYVYTDRSYFIKFDTTRSAGEAIADLKKVLNQLTSIGKTPGEYIDLRIAGRAYYK